MEFASKLRWGMVIVIVTIALLLIGWGMFSIARSIFDSGSSSSNNTSTESDEVTLVEDANVARYSVDGPVVANEDHRSYEIEVTSGVVEMTVYKSYGSEVVSRKSYPNTNAAHDAFMSSLASLNVTDRRDGTTLDDDFAEQGVCPSGRRRVLELDDNIRRWSATCSNRVGTADFSMSSVERLFRRQVPDFSELVQGTGL